PAIQRKVEGEDVDTRLPEDAEGAPFGVLRHQLTYCLRIELPLARHARHLIERGGRTDVWIESAAGGCDQIDGHRCRVARIGSSQRIHASLHSLDQIRIRWTQVGS